jgi:AcrR family transcriptional regulator
MSHEPETRPVVTEPRWHRRKEERPAEILDAALHEFAARGYAAARLDDIAHRAGCTKGTIFLYFANKEELFKALVRDVVLPGIEQAEALAEKHEGTSMELLRELMKARWRMMVDSRSSALPKLMFTEAGTFPELARFYIEEVGARGHAVVNRVLRQGIERGEFRDVDTEMVAKVASAPLLVAALWKHSFQPHCNVALDSERYFDAALDLLLAGLAAPAAGGNTR